MASRRFLFIHYHYPPLRSSGIYRNYFLSTAIAETVDLATVITSNNFKRLHTETLPIHQNITVFPVFTFDYRSLLALINKLRGHHSGAQFQESKKNNKLIQWALRIQRSFPFNIILAEGSVFYIFFAYFKAARLIKEKNIQVLQSSFMPYADHIIGYLLKKRFPSLIWLADFRDLQVEPIYNNTVWLPVQRWFERKILSKADLVTTVSEGISEKMRKYNRPVLTLLKGVDIRSPRKQFDKFTINYSGSLFRHFRDPELVFKTIRSLLDNKSIDMQEIQICYAGKDGNQMSTWIQKEKLDDIFVNKGFVSRQAALELQDRCHINLLLTSSSQEHQGLLTGKLFEYLEAGNPIWCHVTGVYDAEIEFLFSDLNAGFISYDPSDDVIKMSQFVMSKYKEWKTTGSVGSTIDKEKLQSSYSWQAQAKKLLKKVDEVAV